MSEFAKIRVETNVNVGVDRAWKCFTDPESVRRWNFASADWCCPRGTNDLRVGGTFNYRMEAVDGSAGFDFSGEYTEVIAGKRIAYKLGDTRTVSVEFFAEGGRTRLVEVFDAETENPLELQRKGWQAILDNYKHYAESEGR